MLHLRVEGEREWASFPEQATAAALETSFASRKNDAPWTLSLRQQDVKQSWEVRINDRPVGRLVRDENDLRTDFEIPAGTIVEGANRLQILQTGTMDPDDIRVGEIELHAMAPSTLRSGAVLEIVITDQQNQPIPGRITVVDGNGTLMPVGAESSDGIAVREGVLYTATGSATFGLQPGTYRVYAGRGFEYSVETIDVQLRPGDHAKRTLQLSRQVDTTGWIACDTHIHTVTHSGHGDCTIDERMATLAGEGVELAIATDHNKQIDYTEASRIAGTISYFTPVVGNEVTTKRGHFNVFPTRADARVPNHEAPDWQSLFDSIFSTPGVRVAILNHARDLHSGFRPFSPRHHTSLTGVNLDGFDRRFNAMELINSGAVQTDPMQLFGDWCGLINHGLQVTPVGSSDSHDVSRYIVGQGRTYIAGDDTEAGKLDVDAAVDAFLQGKVVVSYGLLAKIQANGSGGPGELVSLSRGQDLELSVEVLGPRWTRADRIELWVNGRHRLTHRVADVGKASTSRRGETRADQSSEGESGRRAAVTWSIPRSELGHDVWITALAVGPGVSEPFWPTAKPYQPDSPEFRPYVFTSTGPLWIDADGDGRYTSPAAYAGDILKQHGFSDQASPDWRGLADHLATVDPSVTLQVLASLAKGEFGHAPLLQFGHAKTRPAINQYEHAWRESAVARLEQVE